MNHIEKSKELGLSADEYVLVGGSVLDIYNIRNSDDIDMVVSKEAFSKLKNENGWVIDADFKMKWGRERLLNGVFEIVQDLNFEYCSYLLSFELLRDAANCIDGVNVQPLGLLLLGKKDMGREKDLADIALIEEYFNNKS